MGMAGVNHVAFLTNDMKEQIEFYTQVVGYELVGIFPFHGVDGTIHCFLDSGNGFLLSFVQHSGEKVEPVYGVSHATDVGGPAAGGAHQHIAMALDTMDDMLGMRDRLRSAGHAVFGPIEHGGMCHSMYLGAPEGIQLEFTTTEGCGPFDPDKWIEAESAAEVGISEDDLKRYRNPTPLEATGGKVPQPPKETAIPPSPIPKPMFDQLGYLSDEDLQKALSFPLPADAAQ